MASAVVEEKREMVMVGNICANSRVTICGRYILYLDDHHHIATPPWMRLAYRSIGMDKRRASSIMPIQIHFAGIQGTSGVPTLAPALSNSGLPLRSNFKYATVYISWTVLTNVLAVHL